MKKILIVSEHMRISGVERALLGLLSELDTEKYEVDLFLRNHDGDFLPLIPKGINLLPEIKGYACLDMTTREGIRRGALLSSVLKAYGMLKAKRFAKKHSLDLSGIAMDYTHKYGSKLLPMISKKEYDLVISFVSPHYIGANKTVGKKRLAWIHTDYSILGLDTKNEEKVWAKFDSIVSISDSVSEGFISKFPSLKDKLVRIDNIVSPDSIRASASIGQDEIKHDKAAILSCGRLNRAKNFRSIPEMAARLKAEGLSFRWYILGDGGDSEVIRENTAKFGVGDEVILLGSRANPYPYIAACDLFVHPSLYEGKAVTVIEAQILGRPVVITDFPTAKGQLKDGYDGVIVPLDTNKCAEGIASLLRDPERMKALSESCLSSDYSSKEDMKRLCSYAD